MPKAIFFLALATMICSVPSRAEHAEAPVAEIQALDTRPAAVPAEKSPIANRQAELEETLANMVDYLDGVAQDPRNKIPLGNVEVALRTLLHRLKDSRAEGAVWFASEPLTLTEKSLLLDNAALLAEYAQEIINQYELDSTNRIENLQANAAAQIEKKWRLVPAKKDKWMVTPEYAAGLEGVGKREGDRRNALITTGKAAEFEELANTLVAKLQTPVTVSPADAATYDSDEIIRRLRHNPTAVVQEQLDKHIADLRRSNPEKARELEIVADKYRRHAQEFRDYLDKEYGRAVEKNPAEVVRAELSKRSKEFREVENDFRKSLEGLGLKAKEKQKLGEDLIAEIEKQKRRLMPEVDRAAEKLKQEIDRAAEKAKADAAAELERAKAKIKKLFK